MIRIYSTRRDLLLSLEGRRSSRSKVRKALALRDTCVEAEAPLLGPTDQADRALHAWALRREAQYFFIRRLTAFFCAAVMAFRRRVRRPGAAARRPLRGPSPRRSGNSL
jgi:hypothetical protein